MTFPFKMTPETFDEKIGIRHEARFDTLKKGRVETMSDLTVDPARKQQPETGIYVRAKEKNHWGSHDIAHLDRESLYTWLRSRGGNNLWAENTVLILLGHTLPGVPR